MQLLIYSYYIRPTGGPYCGSNCKIMTSVYAKEMQFHFLYVQGIYIVIVVKKREDGKKLLSE